MGNAVKFTERGEVVVDVGVEDFTAENAESAEKEKKTSLPSESSRPLLPDSLFSSSALSAFSALKSSCQLHFQVRDTGIGVPADKRRLIFNPFEQADGSLARKYGGTGLGLAISSRLVEKMNGRIWVESEVGQGSTFHFTACLGLSKEPAAPPARTSTLDLRNLAVLVVDDNATNRRILVEMLGCWGMRPTAVAGACEAVAEMERAVADGSPYPLVLLDGHMPEVDGFTLAGQITQRPDLAGATLMMLSSGERPDDAACQELRLAGYLTKPLKQSDLLEAILAALRLPGEAMTPPAVSASSATAQRKLRILLVEDNNVNQRLACHLLGAQGHEVVVAGDGTQALALTERDTFDLVLMDVQMPEMDGLEATSHIRRREQGSTRRVPIVAMTAFAMKGDRERCLEAGMDDYIAKPIQTRELFQAIERLTAVPSRSEVPATEPNPPGAVIDLQAALSSVGGDAALLRELIGLFLDSCPGLLQEIRDAAAAGDPTRVKRAAHTIKGSVGYFSAPAAVVAAQQVERMGRDNDLTGLEEAYRTLEAEIEHLRPILTTFVGR